MSVYAARGKSGLRAASFAVLAATVLWGSGVAPAYFPSRDNSGNPASWKSGSNAGIWDQASRTISWSFYRGNFPQASWPTEAQAGAAFQNAVQTLTDVTGKSLNFLRQADTNTAPASRDGMLTFAFVLNQTSDFYGTNLTGANAVTYVDYDAPTGIMQDADMFINAD